MPAIGTDVLSTEGKDVGGNEVKGVGTVDEGKKVDVIDGCTVEVDGTSVVNFVGFTFVGTADLEGTKEGFFGDFVGRCVGI